MAAAGLHRVGVHAGHPGTGKKPADLLLQPLRARAPLGELWGPTFRTVGRYPVHEAAAVADAAIARRVEREREIALRAADGMAAGPALHLRGEAAAIEQQHHLPAAVERPVDAGGQPRADRAPGATLGIPQVDGDHGRQLRAADAIGEPAHLPRALQAVAERFERRCRRTQHQRHALRAGDPLGHVTGMIARSRGLLE